MSENRGFDEADLVPQEKCLARVSARRHRANAAGHAYVAPVIDCDADCDSRLWIDDPQVLETNLQTTCLMHPAHLQPLNQEYGRTRWHDHDPCLVEDALAEETELWEMRSPSEPPRAGRNTLTLVGGGLLRDNPR